MCNRWFSPGTRVPHFSSFSFAIDEKLSLRTYDASHEGMMDSWRERFTLEEHQRLDHILENLYLKDRDLFKVI